MRLWFAITFAACGSSPARAPVVAPRSCSAVHVRLAETGDEHAMARLLVAAEGLEPSAGKLDPLLSRAAVEACQADRWPDVTIACLEGEDMLARARCLASLSDEQRAHLRARVDEAVATIPAVMVARERRAWRDLPARTGVPACDTYLAAVNRLGHCGTAPGIVVDQLAELARWTVWAVVDLRDAGGDVALDAHAASTGCADAAAHVHQAATTFACP